MDPANKNNNTVRSSGHVKDDSHGNIKQKNPDKFDLSIIGRIDLIEAEKIASEEVIFLTENDLIEGLEEFELVPIKNLKDQSGLRGISFNVKTQTNQNEFNKEVSFKTDDNSRNEINIESNTIEEALLESIDELIIPLDDSNISYTQNDNSNLLDLSDSKKIIDTPLVELKENTIKKDESSNFQNVLTSTDAVDKSDTDESEIISEKKDDLPKGDKLFSVTINEETLDAQLASILNTENTYKTDFKVQEKYSNIIPDTKCRFVDDQFMNKLSVEDSVSYNEDLLTERLVKMIEVADGKLELLEVTSKEGEFFNYILEDYTLYNSEKFDNVFKEEVFYIDTDFEFIENAIIRDDFTKYIHEIDDYFESEESLIQSEISEILGLIPDENEYIEDKLFGDYYKKYDLDNEIDFIKPEIDFFRSSYTGTKNLNYFTENENSILDSEKKSIEEDISSANAIVFEEAISEIEEILRRDFNYDLKENTYVKSDLDGIVISEEIIDITDNIIILDDKEKILKLVSEFPDKHENLIRLLSYLDGLFEKLPEEVIRKFAESEYFELYSKVLKEMGV